MQREAITLKSGHILEVGAPDFGPAKELAKAVTRELLSVDLSLETLNLQELVANNFNGLKNAVLKVASSDEVEKAVFACMTQTLLQGKPINGTTFQPEDMRQDYLPVVWEVMKRALAPFFAGLDWPSSAPAAAPLPSRR
jgi:hypothetical protein